MRDQWLDLLCRNLGSKCSKFALQGEARTNDKARIVFSFWNWERQEFERGAGAAWIRRQWELCPEPTVLLGFEPLADVPGQDGSYPNLAGIAYVHLPARALTIQSAIDEVIASSLGTLDVGTRKRNVKEFADLLGPRNGWLHGFKNSKIILSAARAKLLSRQSHELRQMAYHNVANIPADVIERRSNDFSRLHRHPIVLAHKPIKDKMLQTAIALGQAARQFRDIMTVLSAPFDDEQADRICERLSILRDLLDSIENDVLGICRNIDEIAACPGTK
jgi:hypothetical protein